PRSVAPGARLLPRLRRRRRDRRRDPRLPGPARRRRALALGGARHGHPGPAGQPPLRLRHSPGARRDLRAPGPIRRRDLVRLPAPDRLRGGDPTAAPPLPAFGREGPGDPGARAGVRERFPLRRGPRETRRRGRDRAADGAARNRTLDRGDRPVARPRTPRHLPGRRSRRRQVPGPGPARTPREGEGGRDAALRRAVAPVAQPRARVRVRRAQSAESGTSCRITSSGESLRSGNRFVTRRLTTASATRIANTGMREPSIAERKASGATELSPPAAPDARKRPAVSAAAP